jgi:hypothetical protein
LKKISADVFGKGLVRRPQDSWGSSKKIDDLSSDGQRFQTPNHLYSSKALVQLKNRNLRNENGVLDK